MAHAFESESFRTRHIDTPRSEGDFSASTNEYQDLKSCSI